MARPHQQWLQMGPARGALGLPFASSAVVALVAVLGMATLLGAQVSAAPLLSQVPSGPSAPLGQGAQPGSSFAQLMDDGIVPRKGTSCPLVVPSQVSFLQPKRLKPEEVKAKNAAGCLSPADAIYGADGCPLKLCPNPQWQGL